MLRFLSKYQANPTSNVLHAILVYGHVTKIFIEQSIFFNKAVRLYILFYWEQSYFKTD